MRYDTPIFFQKVTAPGEYDPSTGNHGPDQFEEVKKYADVTESLTETLQLIYGSLKQGSFTIRLQQPYEKAFDTIRIGAKSYRVDWSRRCRVFVVSEVQ